MTTQAENAAATPQAPVVVGVMGEFAEVDSVVRAARRIRAAGFTHWDVHSPFPIHGIDAAMGTKPTILPWLVLGGGLAGLVTGLGLQWFTNAFDFKFMVSGKPYMSLPAFIPVVFELAVLFAALTAVFGMFLLNLLPMLYNPLLKSERFRRVTSDRFFIVIDAADPKFDAVKVADLMRELGATAVEKVED
jgi:hypothetical protein